MQELLGLVLEPQDRDCRPRLDVGEQRALLARADDRVAVRTCGGVADRSQHPLLEHR